MTTTIKPVYAAAAAITLTEASLASAAYRQSAFVDNSTNLYDEAFCNGFIKTGASGVTATGTVSIYIYASYDAGTTYTHHASGSDAAYTPDNAGNLYPVATIAAVANATTYYWDFHVVAGNAWLILPQRWGIIIFNNTGGAFDATAGNFLMQYQGVQLQGV